MALTKCKECKKEVSTKAEKCPHCGVKNPGMSAKDTLVGAVGLFVIVVIGWAIFGPDDEPDSEPSKTQQSEKSADELAAEKAAKAEECRKDIQCWGRENVASATTLCVQAVERRAKYEVKWTDGFADMKLSRRGWLDEDKGTLSYYGDQVQFSNGYGAFENYIYRCDYDPNTDTLLDLQMEPGRI
ncbi:hypothetical protein [Marinobacter sp. NFXS9]|uniref:hypothetical protein n=1 Tax=Marinobacter sp. NFXS9 TaxID=2818433 RepID=UPI0032DF16C4